MKRPSALVAALALAIGAVAGPHAQPAQPNLDDYDNAIRAYLTGGDLPAALKPLRAFSREHFDAAARRIVAGQHRGSIDAAAMFQLEIGVGIMPVAPTEASEHFALGQWLLEQLAPAAVERTAARRPSTRSAPRGSVWRRARFCP